MNAAFKLINSDKIIRLSMLSSGILLLLHATYLFLFYFSLPPVIPLYNQLPWGDTRLGTKLEVVIPLGMTAFFFSFNYFLEARLYMTMPLIARIISITTLLGALLSFIFIVRTLQLIL